ncbi:hypothetical protein V5E97_21990 [Singulisphaera sp. Ch08]|uniref:Uncharacterized protein n=1 Tax=Singulisphaera sp. Ch08 TaxID=3120278 RepID=A0AAU7C7D5_9BACT
MQRRVFLDLTGIPPTAAEQATFLSNDSPDAYEGDGRSSSRRDALCRALGTPLDGHLAIQ